MTSNAARCMGAKRFLRQCNHCARLPMTVREEDSATEWVEIKPEWKTCRKKVEK